MILSILFNGVLLLLNFWSVAIHEFFAYSKLDMSDIKNCTDVRVRIDNQKQKTIKRFIVPLLIKQIAFTATKVNLVNHIEVQKKRFSYNKDKKDFTVIPYPVGETIQFY
jgi:hypothetical protein